jgi:small-conductance mechanosensitive channel
MLAARAVIPLIIAAAFWYGGGVAGRIIERVGTLRNLDASLVRLFARIARIGLIVVGGIVALGTLGIDVSALVAGLGLAGLAIGLALKEILSNALAGIMVIVYKPFKENDRIAVTTFEGRVSDINLRFTTLDAGGKQIFVPNAMVISNAVVVDKTPDAAVAPAKGFR